MSTNGRGIDWASLDPSVAQYLRAQGYSPGDPAKALRGLEKFLPTEKPKRDKGPNKLELAFQATCVLAMSQELLKRVYDPQCMRFTLAGNTHYTPDQAVIESTVHGDRLCLVELKGPYERDDGSRIKIKMAAKEFPSFRWLWVTRVDGAWCVREVTAEKGIGRRYVRVPWIA